MRMVRWPAPALVIVTLLCSAGGVRAQGLAGRLSIALQAGTQAELAGDAVSAAQGTLLGRPATLDSASYGDLYGPGPRVAASLAYGIAARVELTLRGSLYAPRAAPVDLGRFAGGPLLLCFEEAGGASDTCGNPRLREYGLELDLRYTINPQSRFKSYVALAGGLEHTAARLVALQAPEAGAGVLHLPFARARTEPVLGVDLGFTYDVSSRVFLGLESGVRWRPRPQADTALPEFGSFEQGSSRWSAPVLATLGLRL